MSSQHDSTTYATEIRIRAGRSFSLCLIWKYLSRPHTHIHSECVYTDKRTAYIEAHRPNHAYYWKLHRIWIVFRFFSSVVYLLGLFSFYPLSLIVGSVSFFSLVGAVAAIAAAYCCCCCLLQLALSMRVSNTQDPRCIIKLIIKMAEDTSFSTVFRFVDYLDKYASIHTV